MLLLRPCSLLALLGAFVVAHALPAPLPADDLETLAAAENVLILSSSPLLRKAASAAITTYPDAPFPLSTLFSLTANDIPVSVLNVPSFNLSTFSATPGPITFNLKYLGGGDITAASALPSGADLSDYGVSGNVFTFTLEFGTSPRKLEVRINKGVTVIGNPSVPVLYITVDPPETNIPDPNGAGVLYFGPGVHNMAQLSYDQTHPAPSQIYVAPGALVNAAWLFSFINTPVTFSGRGFLRNAFQDTTSPSFQGFFITRNSSNISVRDLHMVEAGMHVLQFSKSHDITIDNAKILQYQKNTDGFGLLGTTYNLLVNNCLLVNSDNQIVISASAPGPYNNLWKNSVFSKLSSGGNFLYLQGTPPFNTPVGSIGANNVVSNIDVLRISGEIGFVVASSLFPGIPIDGLTLDGLTVWNAQPRPGSAGPNRLLYLQPLLQTSASKNIVLQHMALPSGFNGSEIAGPGWNINFNNVSMSGINFNSDVAAQLIKSGSPNVAYSS
ncbi:hypothetical protein T439DRAFT_328713 [Meredithblackwellia eburnea MCA 4105]